MAIDKKAENIIKRFESIKSTRYNFESLVQDAYDFADPTNGQVIEKSIEGEERYQMYDYTANEAVDTFIAGMDANITPSQQRWIEVRSTSEELNDEEDASHWFGEVTRITHSEISKSNFSLEIQQVWADLAIPGRACIICLPGFDNRIRFQSYHYSDTYISESDLGLVDTLYRKFQFTARQAVLSWGFNAVSPKIQKAFSDPSKMDQKFWFLHEIRPNEDRHEMLMRNPRLRTRESLPFSSIYVDLTDKTVVARGGFEELPFACPRFYKANGEVEGRSPIMKCLGIIRTTHAQALTMLKRGNWDADPPIMVPDADLLDATIEPGETFVYKPNASGLKPEMLSSNARYEVAQWVYENNTDAIRKALFQDFFAMMSTLDPKVQRTAFEFNERLNEKVDLLSVVRGRTKNELLDPLMTRTVNLLFRQGAFPDPPQSVIDNPDFEFEYRGRLAVLAKSLEIRGMKGFVDSMIPYSEVFPQVLDKIDSDKFSDEMANAWGATPITRQQDEVDDIRRIRTEQIQAAQNAENAKQATQAVKNLQGETSGTSPLAAIA